MKIRKFIPSMLLACLVGLAATSCLSDDEKLWDDYSDWRNTNSDWLREQEASGKYEKVVPLWNDSLYVLMRWFNDTTLTSGNLTPLYTSEVAVKYKGMLYDGTPFDSSYTQVDSTVTMVLKELISGWPIAMERMHVEDNVEVLIPYQAGYGSSSTGIIPPFSALVFHIELRDITAYELRP
ncbi:MAG: FKBP-type peptidyl-prolyl cis-trans isomerase [Muribaculaceae bacterium]|nr:FKBP-type peptidyl-prolyl cis-trans isomerase [Muribaculaceae bacterium]